MADALLIGLVWWGGLWSLGGSVIGLIPAVGMVLVVASSPWIDADLASRLAGSLVIGCLGWIGVMPLLWSHASSPDWLHAWLMMGTGAGATIALLALMTDGLTRRGRAWLTRDLRQAWLRLSRESGDDGWSGDSQLP
jgi:hypothetical protein